MLKNIHIVLLLLFAFTELFSQTIVYVDSSASGNNDGTSWTNAFNSLQSALDSVILGNQIWVAKGTYFPSFGYDLCDNSGDSTRYYHFRMINSVAIFGGFTGGENSIDDRIDYGIGGNNETILSGDIGINGDISDNCYHIFYHPTALSLDSTAVLNGFTIKDGNADGGTSFFNSGGGVCNFSSSPSIINCTFVSNSARFGGGIMNYDSSPKLIMCTFTRNSAISGGGGMYNNESSSPALINCVIKSNSAGNGGGIFNAFNSSPSLINCTICANSASNYGGGMYNSGLPLLRNCIIWGNNAKIEGDEIAIDESSVTTLNYCCYRYETGSTFINPGSTLITDENCVTANPQFAGSLLNPNHPYSLLGISPCCDAGNNDYNSETYDIRGKGYPRKLDKNTGESGVIDIGAYEFQIGVDSVFRPPIIRYVTVTGTGSKNGLNWENAYDSTQLQTAINESIATQVWVARGIYKPTVMVDGIDERDKAFQMRNGLAIYGGFVGNETSPDQRINYGIGGANETVLSGDIGILGYEYDNCCHVFKNSPGLDTSAVLDGFTITGGCASSAANSINSGGGMYNNSSSPKISNCVFKSNSADEGGGGISNHSSSPHLLNCIFTENSSLMYGGGGIENNEASAPKIINCVFISNSSGAAGGAIFNYSSYPQFVNCTIAGNNSVLDGGGMFSSFYSSVVFKNCIIWGNEATYSDCYDELLVYNGGSIKLNYCCFRNDSGDVGIIKGGVISFDENCITSDPRFAGSLLNPNHPYSLLGISPCCDAGNNDYNSETYDIRGKGYPRKLDKNTGESGVIDIGAYEYKVGVDSVSVKILNKDYGVEPKEFTLLQNYPNPFNPVTTIKYGIPEAGVVRIIIYNISGQKIIELVNITQNPGWYQTIWNGKNQDGLPVSSGVYLCHINVIGQTKSFSKNIKMLFIK
ncbi:MAG TPA: choice-of-anchor Q domain-containing protein [Candidatus Marinimicrobia bacterium]|nr:choice-of-anchor Q domain-containing protein [Candidatus Neomarinimicrobiota bacterium]HRS51009.1 choice-of-anchor Q domain-containing protein [Candidatus Neomarinimicrobiota bacterium]HRU91649.1 choice-of-anchor Q domain-containing protein [Candidatus Neomarinimicrobiota bacterium]